MRFWDASAIVPLCLAEPKTPVVEPLYREDPEIVVCWTTPIECASAFSRLRREEALTLEGEEEALAILDQLARRWSELQPSGQLRKEVMRLLRVHNLRAADSLQLAAAVLWAGRQVHADLVAFDDRLRTAARLEGFAVVPRDAAQGP